jgi:hypothetical protein
MARKPEKNNGTKIGSAARMPATTMTNAATVNRNRPAGVWEENDCISFYSKKKFLVKDPLIYRITCALLMNDTGFFFFCPSRRWLKASLDVRRRGRESSRNVDAGGILTEASFWIGRSFGVLFLNSVKTLL